MRRFSWKLLNLTGAMCPLQIISSYSRASMYMNSNQYSGFCRRQISKHGIKAAGRRASAG